MLPEIKLDTEGFSELLDEYRMMISGIYPEWTDYNYHDPGITFLELFVWLRENQQFYMEQLGLSHYRQFLRLLGLTPKKRCPAKLLACPVLPFSGSIVPKSPFFAGKMGFETEKEEALCGNALEKVLCIDNKGKIQEEISQYPLSCLGDICIYPFGNFPEEGNEFWLCFSSPLTPRRTYHLFGQVLPEMEKKRNPLAGKFYPLAEIAWSCYTKNGWENLSVVCDETSNFLFTGRIEFSFGQEMEKYPLNQQEVYLIRAVLKKNSYDLAPVLSGISMNMIMLVQKETWRPEKAFLLAEGNGFPNQTYVLPWKNPIASSVNIQVEDVLCPQKMQVWEQVDDFSSCSPSSACYMVDEENGSICFGDGFYGMPPEGKIYLTSMEKTEGEGGNSRPKTKLEWNRHEFEAYLETEKGRNQESLEEIIIRLSGYLEKSSDNCPNPSRVVSAEDYEYAVKHTPGLMIVSCKVLEEWGRDNQVAIVVRPGDGKQNLSLSQAYRLNILHHLDARRLIGTKILLYSPEYIELNLYLEVSAMPQYRQAKEMILGTVRGWFEYLGTFFGKPVVYGRLYGMIDSMAWVKRIRVLNVEAKNAGVRRNLSGDLIPPANGVFWLNHIDYVAVND